MIYIVISIFGHVIDQNCVDNTNRLLIHILLFSFMQRELSTSKQPSMKLKNK